jgi:hypothetical protein
MASKMALLVAATLPDLSIARLASMIASAAAPGM